MKTDKPWGVSELLVKTETTELHRIVVKEDGFSSYHYHQHKFNMIYVESGKLLILQDEGSKILHPGERIVLAPNEKHSFKALVSTIAYEFYWVMNNVEDIIRL